MSNPFVKSVARTVIIQRPKANDGNKILTKFLFHCDLNEHVLKNKISDKILEIYLNIFNKNNNHHVTIKDIRREISLSYYLMSDFKDLVKQIGFSNAGDLNYVKDKFIVFFKISISGAYKKNIH